MNRSGSSVTGAPAPRCETATEKQQRVPHEAALLAQGRASAATGRTVSETQVDSWIDSLGTDHELPLPHSGR